MFPLPPFPKSSMGRVLSRLNCGSAFWPWWKKIGAVSNINLRDINIELSNPTFEMTDHNREKRGKCAVEVSGVDTIHFDNVKIEKSDDVDLDYYSEENSVNVTKRDCNF